MYIPFFLSRLTALCIDGVLELDLSGSGAFVRPFWGGGAGLAVVVCVCLAAAAAAADADDDDIAGISLISLASMPISCICLARFSAWLMNCIGADNASTRSVSTATRSRQYAVRTAREAFATVDKMHWTLNSVTRQQTCTIPQRTVQHRRHHHHHQIFNKTTN